MQSHPSALHTANSALLAALVLTGCSDGGHDLAVAASSATGGRKLEVTPSLNLLSPQVVHITGTGFDPNEQVGTPFCKLPVNHRDILNLWSQCQLVDDAGQLLSQRADANGNFQT